MKKDDETFISNSEKYPSYGPCYGWERSGSEVDCSTRDQGAMGSNLTGVIALCPGVRHINPSVVPVQPRKTGPYISERLLIGRKESNQTNTLMDKQMVGSIVFPMHNFWLFCTLFKDL